jgi:hypothetical protein
MRRTTNEAAYTATLPKYPLILPHFTTLWGGRRSVCRRVYSEYQHCHKALNAPVTQARSGRRATTESRAGWGRSLTSWRTHLVSPPPHTGTRAPTRVSVCFGSSADRAALTISSLRVRGITLQHQHNLHTQRDVPFLRCAMNEATPILRLLPPQRVAGRSSRIGSADCVYGSSRPSTSRPGFGI